MTVVLDASPLVALARIGRLSLLHEMFGRVAVPDAVWREVVEAGFDKPGSSEVSSAAWIDRRPVANIAMVSLLRRDLGAGEAEAIVLAREIPADLLVMDEAIGRSAARQLGVPTAGLVGVLIEARERRLLPDAAQISERLHREAGFWLSAELRRLITGN